MDTTATLLIAAGVLALGDWVAVALRIHRAEYVLKPATLAVLLAAAAVGPVEHGLRWYVVAALGLGLLGDIAIMVAAPDRTDGWFLAGLAAFLLGHAAYIAAFLRHGVHGWYVLAGALVAAGIGGLTLPPAVAGAVRQGRRELGLLVALYAVVIGVMATAAAGTSLVLTALGGALFVVSDGVLSRERFVRRTAWGRVPIGEVAVIITYHAAQGLILLGLLHEHWLHG